MIVVQVPSGRYVVVSDHREVRVYLSHGYKGRWEWTEDASRAERFFTTSGAFTCYLENSPSDGRAVVVALDA